MAVMVFGVGGAAANKLQRELLSITKFIHKGIDEPI